MATYRHDLLRGCLNCKLQENNNVQMLQVLHMQNEGLATFLFFDKFVMYICLVHIAPEQAEGMLGLLQLTRS